MYKICFGKNGWIYCILPHKTAIGSSWGGVTIYIYIYFKFQSCSRHPLARYHQLSNWSQQEVSRTIQNQNRDLHSNHWHENPSWPLRRHPVPQASSPSGPCPSTHAMETNLKQPRETGSQAEQGTTQSVAKNWMKIFSFFHCLPI